MTDQQVDLMRGAFGQISSAIDYAITLENNVAMPTRVRAYLTQVIQILQKEQEQTDKPQVKEALGEILAILTGQDEFMNQELGLRETQSGSKTSTASDRCLV